MIKLQTLIIFVAKQVKMGQIPLKNTKMIKLHPFDHLREHLRGLIIFVEALMEQTGGRWVGWARPVPRGRWRALVEGDTDPEATRLLLAAAARLPHVELIVMTAGEHPARRHGGRPTTGTESDR